MNWIKDTHILQTHTSFTKFMGQAKGRLHFSNEKIELIFSPKEVNDMIRVGEWFKVAATPL